MKKSEIEKLLGKMILEYRSGKFEVEFLWFLDLIERVRRIDWWAMELNKDIE